MVSWTWHSLTVLSPAPLLHTARPLPLSSLYHVSSLQTLQEEEKATSSASKKPGRGRPLLGREKSADSSSTSSSASAEKQRQEARKRLLAAKKAASFRQNSATESADSIEIYVPEAQTRLWEKQWEGRIKVRIKGLISVTEYLKGEEKLLQCKWATLSKLRWSGGARSDWWVWAYLTLLQLVGWCW